MATYQERYNGLLAIGMPKKLAAIIAFRPELVGEVAIAAEVAMNPSLEIAPRLAAKKGAEKPLKRRRRTTQYQKNLSKALVEENAKQRKKNGDLKKGKSAGSILKAAHKTARKMTSTKKGQVRKTARRAYERK